MASQSGRTFRREPLFPEVRPEPTIAEILASDTESDFALPEAVPVPEEI
jgi:hypothetical protein